MELLIREQQQDVSDEVISRCKTHKDALRLMKISSGYNDKQFCQELEIDAGTWSRIWNGTANFPDDDKLNKFICMCNSTISLRWYAQFQGHGIHKLLSEIEKENRRLKIELEEEKKKTQVITEFMKSVKV